MGGAVLGRSRYALCLSSAEDTAEGPSETSFEPSAVDLATSAVGLNGATLKR